MFLLSMKAGLRAKEMASLTWAMVTDAQGQVAEVLHVPNRASKGKTGGRTIPLHPDLQAALGLKERDELAFRLRIALDVALRHGETGMAREFLHVPETPADLRDFAGRTRHEGAAAGMRRTPVHLQRGIEPMKP